MRSFLNTTVRKKTSGTLLSRTFVPKLLLVIGMLHNSDHRPILGSNRSIEDFRIVPLKPSMAYLKKFVKKLVGDLKALKSLFFDENILYYKTPTYMQPPKLTAPTPLRRRIILCLDIQR